MMENDFKRLKDQFEVIGVVLERGSYGYFELKSNGQIELRIKESTSRTFMKYFIVGKMDAAWIKYKNTGLASDLSIIRMYQKALANVEIILIESKWE